MLLVASFLATFALAGPPVASPPVSAGGTPPTAPVPAATFLRFSPETLELGEMISGKPKTGTLTVTNITGGPITVEAIKGACGCTTIAGTPKDSVAAGASFSVEITVDPGNKTGVDLAKAVHFQLDGKRTQSMTVTGHVKMVVRVSPDVVDASAVPSGANATVTLESVDQGEFSITAVDPAGIIELPKGKASQQKLSIDLARWEAAGRPSKITLSTDKVDAEKLVIPMKSAPAVVLYRLPAAPASSPERVEREAAQDAAILALDARIGESPRSNGFRMRLHRETGMLFVHGTQGDAEVVNEAVKSLPADTGIREATHE
jgi:hypothetical protein